MANRPQPNFNTDLPIWSRADEIVAALRAHPVVIVSGETGSGKTTQIPQFCLAAGRGVDGLIGCTQPRRIAATSVAERIAEELGVPLGEAVGYKIRFRDRTAPDTFIKVMTDGILLTEAQQDPWLKAYDTLIVDEAHERSLNIDFVLGLLKNRLRQRSDLKLIITSATIDTHKFSRAFDRAPIIEVSGRMYPVETRFLDDLPDLAGQRDLTPVEMAVQAADRVLRTSRRGDVLIFMPTEQDIRETCELLEGRRYPQVTILPLYARLSAAEQKRVFGRLAGRKIVVATNVAETSLTIPDIHCVIDTGLARIARYTPRTRTTSLPVEAVSRSSADQRQGRCGRVADGLCLRLFTRADYEARPLFTPPEILRANLADVILRMIALRLGDVRAFPFIDAPAPQRIQDGFDLLVELGAVTTDPAPRVRARTRRAPGDAEARYRLTADGRLMARLPVDPRLSRMIIEARRTGCLEELLVIAAALSIADPRERPLAQETLADRAQAVFTDPASDFISLLNIWRRVHTDVGDPPKSGALKKFCQAHFLSFKRMREWRDIHSQLCAIVKAHHLGGAPPAPAPEAAAEGPFAPRYAAVHQAVLAGFLANIAQQKEKNLYRAAKGREVMLFPGSGLFNRGGGWVVAAEMVATSRLFARTAARIDSRWLEPLGKDQCRSTYLDPHWDKQRGAVMAFEQVSLFGLVIVSRRLRPYGPVDPQAATDIFIRRALIDGDVQRAPAFLQFNRRQVDAIRSLEDRLRRRDLLVDEPALFAFYAARLDRVWDLRTLAQRIRQKGGDAFLRFPPELLLAKEPDRDALTRFPDRVRLGTNTFACNYRFKPGQDDDGLTVQIPAAQAAAVEPAALDWLVPGLLAEKFAVLLKALPKPLRKKLVPLNTAADIIAAEMPHQAIPLPTALSRFVHTRFGLDIPAAAWDLDALPDHLRMRLALTAPGGKTLRSGRNPAVLLGADTPPPLPPEVAAARRRWERRDLRTWDFEDLPPQVALGGADGARWPFYPGLAVEDDRVALRLFEDPDAARRAHPTGVAALLARHFARELKYLKTNLSLPPDTAAAARWFGGLRALNTSLFARVCRDLFERDLKSRDAFESYAATLASGLHRQGATEREALLAVLERFWETREALAGLASGIGRSAVLNAFLEQLQAHLERLAPPNLLELYDTGRLQQLPRYITALAVRARRGVLDLPKDRRKEESVAPHAQRLQAFLQGLEPGTSPDKRRAIEDFHWLVEEWRVAVFAPEVGTAHPVSPQRLERLAGEIERML